MPALCFFFVVVVSLEGKFFVCFLFVLGRESLGYPGEIINNSIRLIIVQNFDKAEGVEYPDQFWLFWFYCLFPNAHICLGFKLKQQAYYLIYLQTL